MYNDDDRRMQENKKQKIADLKKELFKIEDNYKYKSRMQSQVNEFALDIQRNLEILMEELSHSIRGREVDEVYSDIRVSRSKSLIRIDCINNEIRSEYERKINNIQEMQDKMGKELEEEKDEW